MADGSCTVSWMKHDTMEFRYVGTITRSLLVDAYAAYRAERKTKTEHFQYVDVLGVTSLEPDAVELIGKVLADFRAGGGKHVVMVANEGFARMMGSSMSFSAGTSLSFCPSRMEGVAELARLRRTEG